MDQRSFTFFFLTLRNPICILFIFLVDKYKLYSFGVKCEGLKYVCTGEWLTELLIHMYIHIGISCEKLKIYFLSNFRVDNTLLLIARYITNPSNLFFLSEILHLETNISLVSHHHSSPC